MWLKNFINECKAWRIVRKEIKNHKSDLESVGLKWDWFGRLYKVINRDPEIELGSEEDAVYLQNDLAKIWNVLIKIGIVDILAYELKPLEDSTILEDGTEEYEHAYLVILTPAWNLDKQYVTFKSVSLLTLFIISIITIIIGLIYFL